MMILNMIACIVLFMAFILIMMGIIVRKLRDKRIRDAKKKIYEKIDVIMDDMEENRS